jgi:hypothetical protein
LLTDYSASIVGEGDEELVFTTATKTFLLRKAETTNALLLLPPASAESPVPGSRVKHVVQASLSHHFELVEIPPRVAKIRALLMECPYKGSASEDVGSKRSAPAESEDHAAKRTAIAKSVYTMDDLLQRVQASPAQIHMELAKLNAFEEDGVWEAVSKHCTGTGVLTHGCAEQGLCGCWIAIMKLKSVTSSF